MIPPRGILSRVPRLAGLASVCSLVALLVINLASADSPWPTPPPAPLAPQPRIESDITPVPVPAVPGATSTVIQPISQGPVPLIPPLNSTTFDTQGHLKITIEDGSLDRTIQLTYAPVPADQAPSPIRLQQLVTVFDLKSFDAQGREIQSELLRPWIVEVPVSRLPAVSVDPSRLVLARFEEGRWAPLVTSYFRDDNVLVARILKAGRFAILAESRPI